jgi:hypothetical protein
MQKVHDLNKRKNIYFKATGIHAEKLIDIQKARVLKALQ